MGFSFGNIKVNQKKSAVGLQLTDRTVLADTSLNLGTDVNVLVDYLYPQETINVLMDWLRYQGLLNCKVIYVLNCIASRAQAEKDGIIKFYRQNKVDLYAHMIPKAPVITVGPALYSLLCEDDIYPSHTEQAIFGKTNFFFSKDLTTANGHWVHPIASLEDMMDNSDSLEKGNPRIRDCYKAKLAEAQFTLLANNPFKPIYRYPKLNKIFIESKEDFDERFYLPNKDRHDEVLAWDIETSSFDFLTGEIGCITLSFDGNTGYYIPWKYVDKKKLGEVLKNNRQCGANLKFDIRWLWANGVPEARIDEDVILGGHTLDETRRNSLKALAYYYSEYGGYERDLDAYKEKVKVDNYLHIPEELLREYAVMDAIVTRRVWTNLMAHMRELDARYPNEFSEDGLVEYYYLRRIPAANMYARFEYNGCYVDKKKLDSLRNDMKEFLVNKKKELSKAFGVSENFDWGSQQELGKLLEKAGWEDLGRTEAGTYKTADFQLHRWEKIHPESLMIQDMRSVSVLLNSFVGDDEGTKGWSQYLKYHPEDDSYRMHASYQAMMTDGGRTKCSNPNMQNTPTRGLFAKEIKSCIATPNDDEYYMVTVDYAALQGRIAAMDYDVEDSLKAVFRQNGDFHSRTAHVCFCSNGKTFDVMDVEVEQDGQIYHFLGEERVQTQRGEIFAKDLQEDDTIIFEVEE